MTSQDETGIEPAFEEEEDSSVFYVERARLKTVKAATIEKAKEVLVQAKTRTSPPPPR